MRPPISRWNALRVHTTTTALIRMSADSLSLREARLAREVRHLHEWYIPGHRYPVCGTETRTTYDGDRSVAETRRSYQCLPDSQAIAADPANGESPAGNGGGTGEESGARDVIRYQVHDDGSAITVEYSLDCGADVSVMLCDSYGTVYRSHTSHEEAGGGHSVTIDHTSLRHGSYVLYITANGVVHGEKFTKR